MPKETIHSGRIMELTTVPKTDTHPEYLQFKEWDGAITKKPLRQEPSLHLVWSEDHVQFGLQISRHQFLECAAEFERQPELEDMTIYTGVVTRWELNKGVKAIQRARNKVFEPDA
jgi:hypothetical protein